MHPIIELVLSGPSLPGAACADRDSAALFDPPEHGEEAEDLDYRRTAALRLCAACPALDACRQHAPEFAALPGSRLFVLAGEIIDQRQQRSRSA